MMRMRIRILVLIILVPILSVSGCKKTNPYREQQEKLAVDLMVNISDYPYEKTFPTGYFKSLLKPGMSLDEVHSIVLGYEKVYRCEDYMEVYYYFDSSDDKALRFKIFYEENLTFSLLQGEDTNSKENMIEGCTVGLLEVQ